MIELREYQQRAINQLYAWFESGNEGNPCLVLPTGSGKSHIVAALCKDALQKWPDTTILMVTHVKELIEQNAEKMRQHWRGAPMGIYSSAIGKKQLGEPITFAGIQSVRNKASQIGHIDLCIIDEAHLVSHKDEGGYRTFLADLKKINPSIRVIGLTATPWRLGHGIITEGDALFDALIEPVGIEELILGGYLATLKSKLTKSSLDTAGVGKRGGEFIESELQAAVDNQDSNERIVSEIINLAGDRRAWLLFCTGVQHAHHIAEILCQRGIAAECVTGTTTKSERERMIADFKAGRLRALTNANVLTTGFDYPDIDLIAMLRPTMSPSLYVQMAGRGMRIKSHTDHCLVLDFAGVVQTHGPITAVQPPRKSGPGDGEMPVKVCDNCFELCALSVRKCPSCGAEFPEPDKKKMVLHHDDDIMGINGIEMNVTSWSWRKHTSKSSGIEMLAVTYYGELSDKPVTEYVPILHDGYAGRKAWNFLTMVANHCGADLSVAKTSSDRALDLLVDEFNGRVCPELVEFKKDGKFYQVIRRVWRNEKENTVRAL